MKKAFSLLAGLVLAAALPAAADFYRIGPLDLLSISIYQQADLSGEVRVGEDGTMSLPLVGAVAVAGQTLESLTQDLTKRYTEYLNNPQITVFVKEFHGRQISVLGEVARPGLYRLIDKATLLEAISQAGGLTEDSGDRVVVLRPVRKGETGEPEAVIVNTQDLLTPTGMKSANIELQDGDTVNIPRAEHYFVFGEVARPGSYKLEKGNAITVLKAISIAGGFTDKAQRRSIRITREVGDQKTVIKADLDTQVRSQDIIIVPESFF